MLKWKTVSYCLVGNDETCWVHEWFIGDLTAMLKRRKKVTAETIREILRDMHGHSKDAYIVLNMSEDKYQMWAADIISLLGD